MSPSNELKLIGYNNLFNEIVKITNENNFVNKILFSGKKGIGKSVFAYHLINYIFSKNEDFNYDLKNLNILKENKSYKLINNNTHPNFFKIYLKSDKKNVEISQIREMINFTNMSTFDNKKKIVLIDDVEHLNINSVNALLKIIEDSENNILFLLIYNNEKKIMETLKSRCIEFKFNLDYPYIETIINNYFDENIYQNISIDFKNKFNSPDLYISYINICKEFDLDINITTVDNMIDYLIKKNLYKKNPEFKEFLKNCTELYFRKKITKLNSNNYFNLYSYFNKKFYNIKRFNLDVESFFMEFQSKILNE